MSSLGHREHLRIAYVYLADHCLSQAIERVRSSIHNFLRYRAVDPGKYHETISQAWMMAVRHFMEGSPTASSSDAFLDQNPRLLDTRIMLTHYSSELLFSDNARAVFVEPDLDPIPRYDD
jgi:hypothetical protein